MISLTEKARKNFKRLLEEEDIEDTVGTIEVLVTANDGVDGEESKDISPGEVDNVTTEES